MHGPQIAFAKQEQGGIFPILNGQDWNTEAGKDPQMARVVIVGGGVVGTATGVGLGEAGHDVTFIDILPERVEWLRSQGLDASLVLELPSEPSFVFLTLPTPHHGRSYDLSVFTKGVEDVGSALRDAQHVHTIIVRSTVPPGTTEGMVLTTLEASSGKRANHDFELASNPEFLRAASAADDFRQPWMTVVASRNENTRKQIADLLAPFGGPMKIYDDPATAEFIKCTHNIFNATKISFWNEMWKVADQLGLDADAIAETVAESAEGSFNRYYGIRGGAPYGGMCLPKDTNGFLGFARELGIEMPLLDAVIRVNESMEAASAEGFDALPAILAEADSSATP
jgi:UDPglucose 6-dehydrogenase